MMGFVLYFMAMVQLQGFADDIFHAVFREDSKEVTGEEDIDARWFTA